MLYKLLADSVALLHLAFVLFVVGGGFLALKWRWVVWLHLPAAAWGAAVEFGGWMCPLTPLELWLRESGGEAGSQSDFIARHILPMLYPAGLTREAQFALGALVVIVNLAIYGWLWRRMRRTPAAGQ
ncbi:MAG: DUF2784 domain-containing protein [Nitrospirota bacterium]